MEIIKFEFERNPDYVKPDEKEVEAKPKLTVSDTKQASKDEL